jgi:polyphosphate kinase 2 (PPK2 family)
MSGVNTESCEVIGFKQPRAEELDHDFLWRTNCRLPARSRIGIFNRSYYEEALVVRVHPEILRGPGTSRGVARRERYLGAVSSISNERARKTVKIFLHLSGSDSWRALKSQTRIRSTAPPTLTRGNIGNTA